MLRMFWVAPRSIKYRDQTLCDKFSSSNVTRFDFDRWSKRAVKKRKGKSERENLLKKHCIRCTTLKSTKYLCLVLYLEKLEEREEGKNKKRKELQTSFLNFGICKGKTVFNINLHPPSINCFAYCVSV